jgi:hypothetical protein
MVKQVRLARSTSPALTAKQKLIASLRQRMNTSLEESKKQRVFGRVRVGTKGVSGPKGTMITQQMISRIHMLAQNKTSPNRNTALVVSAVLKATVAGDVNVQNYSGEHQVLVNIVNGILAAESKKEKVAFKLNPKQSKVLDYFYSLTLPRE